MSQILKPWIFHTRLFYAFFHEHTIAQKMLGAALIGMPLKRVLALEDQGTCIAASARKDRPALRMRLILDGASPVLLDVETAFHHDPARKTHASFYNDSRSFRPLTDPAVFRPEKPFVRVILTFQNPDRENSFFYGQISSDDPLISTRILNLAACPSPSAEKTIFFAITRLFLVTHSSELTSLTARFPSLAPIASFLEDILRERELTSIFSDHGSFSPAGSSGISAMCSLNRLLLRENRITDLKKISRDPEALKKVFQEFRNKGYL